jgi:hypothetical protein
MLHVRALFRVMSFERNSRGTPLFNLSATTPTRNGVPCEENKRFSKWTPSGQLELTHEPTSVLVERDYMYLDIYKADEAPAPPEGSIRVQMWLGRYEVDASGGPCFYIKAYPGAGVRGYLSMQITNFDPVLIGLFALAPGEEPRALVVDLSRADGIDP